MWQMDSQKMIAVRIIDKFLKRDFNKPTATQKQWVNVSRKIVDILVVIMVKKTQITLKSLDFLACWHGEKKLQLPKVNGF